MGARAAEAIIGRDHPAGLLRAEIDRATDSHGGLVLVTGEAGIGKTTLVTDAADEARRPRRAGARRRLLGLRRARPATGRGCRCVRGAAPRRADDWAAAQRGRRAPGWRCCSASRRPATHDDGDATASFALYDAVTTALVAVSQRRPVVVVLDDLHWADPASLRLLEFAAQHTWFERLLLVGTYRDVEVEAADHPLRPLMAPLVAKATTVTLTGLSRDEVGALIARTAGREPDADAGRRGAPAHRRQPVLRRADRPAVAQRRLGHGGRARASATPYARRLALLPAAVVELLTAAAVLGREFHRQVLAACVGVAGRRRSTGCSTRRVAARLVVAPRRRAVRVRPRPGPRDALRRARPTTTAGRRHAAVVRGARPVAGARRAGCPAPTWPATPTSRAGDLSRDRAVELLVAAARGRRAGWPSEEAIGHYAGRWSVVDDQPAGPGSCSTWAASCYHSGERDEARRLFDEAAATRPRARRPELLARVALTVHRHQRRAAARDGRRRGLLREAHRRLHRRADPAAPVPARWSQDLSPRTERLARRGRGRRGADVQPVGAARLDLGPRHRRGTAALTIEMAEVARRTGDHDTELLATSLRWVALLELGDPALPRPVARVRGAGERDPARPAGIATSTRRSIIAAPRGDFAEADAC